MQNACRNRWKPRFPHVRHFRHNVPTSRFERGHVGQSVAPNEFPVGRDTKMRVGVCCTEQQPFLRATQRRRWCTPMLKNFRNLLELSKDKHKPPGTAQIVTNFALTLLGGHTHGPRPNQHPALSYCPCHALPLVATHTPRSICRSPSPVLLLLSLGFKALPARVTHTVQIRFEYDRYVPRDVRLRPFHT